MLEVGLAATSPRIVVFERVRAFGAHGQLSNDGEFVTNTVHARHDDNYMPPEVADSLAKRAASKAAAGTEPSTEN